MTNENFVRENLILNCFIFVFHILITFFYSIFSRINWSHLGKTSFYKKFIYFLLYPCCNKKSDKRVLHPFSKTLLAHFHDNKIWSNDLSLGHIFLLNFAEIEDKLKLQLLPGNYGSKNTNARAYILWLEIFIFI